MLFKEVILANVQFASHICTLLSILSSTLRNRIAGLNVQYRVTGTSVYLIYLPSMCHERRRVTQTSHTFLE